MTPLSKSMPAASMPKKPVEVRPSPTHQMTTRAKSKVFRLMDLPPELRGNIFRFALHQDHPDPVDLAKAKLPALLSTSRAVRTEALPIFFSELEFFVALRSNWCDDGFHFHGPGYHGYINAGELRLSPAIKALAEGSVDKRAIRFRNVEFNVTCVCCLFGPELGEFQLAVANKKPQFNASNNATTIDAEDAFDMMVDSAFDVVYAMKDRARFNGFSVSDIRSVAYCCCVETDEDLVSTLRLWGAGCSWHEAAIVDA